MLKFNQILGLFLVISLFSSCVSNRKYLEELNARKEAEETADSELKSRVSTEKQLEELKKKHADLTADFKLLSDDYKTLQESYDDQKKLMDDTREAYDKLLELYKKLKDETATKKLELDKELSDKRAELDRQEKNLRILEENLRKEREALNQRDASISDLQKLRAELEKELEGREKRIKDLESAIKERDSQTEALRKRLNDALKGFADNGDLAVEVRNGKVYVSLSQKLLFASGSAKVDKRGIDALKSVADVLSKNNDFAILVEGHTDSDGDDKLNWDLSSSRAMSVTQELIKNGVKPERLTAAGRGEHAPKVANDNDQNKGINRRTEIILEPKLDEIMGILNK